MDGTEIPIDGRDYPISEVTIYRSDRAIVQRRIPINVKSGQNSIVIDCLSSVLDEDSIRVKAETTSHSQVLTIFDVVYSAPTTHTYVRPKPSTPEIKALEEEKAALRKVIETLYLPRTALAHPHLAHAVRSIAVHSLVDLDGLDNKAYDGLFAAEDHSWFGKSLQDHDLECGSEFGVKEGSNDLLTDMCAIQKAMKGRGLADGFSLGLVSHGLLIALPHILEKLDMFILQGRTDVATVALTCFEACFSHPIPEGLTNIRTLHMSQLSHNSPGYPTKQYITTSSSTQAPMSPVSVAHKQYVKEIVWFAKRS
ncbi:hypothetical protein DL93DRAFT_2154596 [Clavulina sp. PMI_390]|nr:hypothetical protein DL93DRAFT_2154596 [Clavulina sp. PMI_390]